MATQVRGAPLSGGEALELLRGVKIPDATQRLHRAIGREPADRCAAHPVRQVRRALPFLDPASRKTLLDLLGTTNAPPKTSLSASGKSVEHKLSFWYETPNFSFEWGSDIKNEDGSAPPRDANNNLVPDVVELWASYFEHSYAEIRLLGFTDTTGSLDDFKISVYLGNSDPTATIDNIGDYYGFTDGDFPHVAGTPPAYIVVAPNFSELASYNPNDESVKDTPGDNAYATRGAMMATAAHELHHVFQYIYVPPAWGNATSADAVDWFLEGSSTWIEDRVYPFVNDYRQYYSTTSGWQLFPEYPLAPPDNRQYPNGSVRISRIYGSAIFPAYIAEHLGGPAAFTSTWKHMKGGALVAEALARAADEAAGTSGKWSMEDVVLGFAATNAVMDYEDGEVFGRAQRRQRSSATSTPFPEMYGSSLSDPSPIGPQGKTLSLSAPLPKTAWGIAATAPVEDSQGKFNLILPTRASKLAFTPTTGSKVTTVAAYLGPSPTTWSFAMSLDQPAPTDTLPPARVGGVWVAPVTGGFAARWLKTTDDKSVAAYVVEWKKAGEEKWKGRTILGGITSAEIRGLAPETDYLARVFAYDLAGNLGEPCEAIPFKSGPAPPYPPPVAGGALLIEGLPDQQAIEGGRITLDLKATAAPSPDVTFTASQLPQGATLNGSIFDWTPDFEQAGLHLMTFTASSGEQTASAPLFIRVANTNRAPQITAAPLATDQDKPADSSVSLSDPDLGDVVTLTVDTPPAHGIVELTGPTSYRYTPEVGYSGSDLIVFAASDLSLESVATEVAVTVVAAPTPPTPPTPPPPPTGQSSGSGAGCFIDSLSR